jgi:hypothetical protein
VTNSELDFVRYCGDHFENFSMFLSIIGYVLRCPKDKLCDKLLHKGLFKRFVQATGRVERNHVIFTAQKLSTPFIQG